MYLDYAGCQVWRYIPMTRSDWAEKIDAVLQFSGAEILQDNGRVTAEIARAFAESEFEQYRREQTKTDKTDKMTEFQKKHIAESKKYAIIEPP